MKEQRSTRHYRHEGHAACGVKTKEGRTLYLVEHRSYVTCENCLRTRAYKGSE